MEKLHILTPNFPSLQPSTFNQALHFNVIQVSYPFKCHAPAYWLRVISHSITNHLKLSFSKFNHKQLYTQLIKQVKETKIIECIMSHKLTKHEQKDGGETKNLDSTISIPGGFAMTDYHDLCIICSAAFSIHTKIWIQAQILQPINLTAILNSIQRLEIKPGIGVGIGHGNFEAAIACELGRSESKWIESSAKELKGGVVVCYRPIRGNVELGWPN